MWRGFQSPKDNPAWKRVECDNPDGTEHKYHLLSDWSYQSKIYELPVKHRYFERFDNGKVWVRRGYRWDGPSGITIDTPNFVDCSLPHDVEYQIMREFPGCYSPQNRLLADQQLYFHCRCWGGMVWIRAQWVYRAVRLFGDRHARPSG